MFVPITHQQHPVFMGFTFQVVSAQWKHGGIVASVNCHETMFKTASVFSLKTIFRDKLIPSRLPQSQSFLLLLRNQRTVPGRDEEMCQWAISYDSTWVCQITSHLNSPDRVKGQLFEGAQTGSNPTKAYKSLVEVIRESGGAEHAGVIGADDHWVVLWHQHGCRMVSQIIYQLQHLNDDKKGDISSMCALVCSLWYVHSGMFTLLWSQEVCTWLEMGHTSTATPLLLDRSRATGWRGRAKPWPIREVFNRRASNKFWSTSVPSRSEHDKATSLLWDVWVEQISKCPPSLVSW